MEINFTRSVYYSILSIFKGFRKNILLHLISIFTVWVCFFVLNLSLNAFFNMRSFLNVSNMRTHISVYYQQELDNSQFKEFEEKNCSRPFVDRCEYLTTAKAKERFVQKNPDLKETLEVLDENPFPPSIEIEFQKDFKSIDTLKSFASELQKEKGVLYVDDGGKWVSNWIQILNLFDRLTYMLAIVFGCIIVFVISNTIQLLVYSRRDEVEILSLVGATRNMIRLPFLTEGVLHGLIGSFFSIVTAKIAMGWLIHYIHTIWPGFLPEQIVFIPWHIQILIVVGAGLVGFVGAFLAVGKFLK